jgi:hypothetical protein
LPVAGVCAAVVLAVACGVVPAGGQAPADSSRESLQAELDALMREIHGDRGEDDAFAGGRSPDLVVVTSSDVAGEVGPCG